MVSLGSLIDLFNNAKFTKELSQEEKDSFNTYFDVSYHFEDDNKNNVILMLEAYFKNDQIKAEAIFNSCFLFSLSTLKISSYCSIDNEIDNGFCEHTYYLYQKVKENHPELESEILTNLERLAKSLREQYKKKFTESFDSLCKKIDITEITLNSSKVHIIPYIDYDKYDLKLSLKISRGKEYTVTNIKTFITKIDTSANFKYGKDLEFIHDINIFDDSSKKIIDIVRDIVKSTYFYSTKSITVPYKFIERLFFTLKDETIFYNNQQFVIRLKEWNPSIHINKDYELIPRFLKYENIEFIERFIIDNESKTIDIISLDENYSSLINNILVSPIASIEDRVEEFKYAFLLKYPSLISYDKEIEEELTFNELKIKVYFDFNNHHYLDYKEELTLDNKPITVNDLTRFNLKQYSAYKAILDSYGFIDNEIQNDSKIWDFLTADLAALKNVAEVYFSEALLNLDLSTFKVPSLRINYSNNLLDVFLEDSKYTEEELLEILSSIRKKRKFIKINNKIINVSGEDAEKFYEDLLDFNMLEKGQIQQSVELPLYYAFKALQNEDNLTISKEAYQLFDTIKNFKTYKMDIPSINGQLRPYQIEGVKWLEILYKHNLCGVLADDMGLGKTIEMITFIKSIKTNAPILIVSPKSLIFNWQNEFARFDDSALVVPIYGASKEREKIISSMPLDQKIIYLTSYDSLRMDEELYKNIEFELMILDEAQYIKNARAKKTITVNNIKSNHRFVLTGTPIENSVLDLWSIFNFLMPGYFPSIESFKTQYESDESYTKVIQKKVSPFILRRNKKDVLKDLPPKYEVIRTCEMNTEQKKIYDAERFKAKETMSSGGGAFDVLYVLTRLRQICIDPSLYVDNYKSGSGKMDTLLSIIDEYLAGGHRILIFSQFVKALDLVETQLKSRQITYFKITGDTDSKERVQIANEFNNSKKTKIGLVSLKAGGTGLNLIGADTVIHLDPWWNVAAQDQATDRAYRIGQDKNVEVIKLICENSIEQRVIELQNKKKDIISKLISENDSSISQMSLEDIKFILN